MEELRVYVDRSKVDECISTTDISCVPWPTFTLLRNSAANTTQTQDTNTLIRKVEPRQQGTSTERQCTGLCGASLLT